MESWLEMDIAMIKPIPKNVSMMVEIAVVLASMHNIVQNVSALATLQIIKAFQTLWLGIMASQMHCLAMDFAMMKSTLLSVGMMVLIVVE